MEVFLENFVLAILAGGFIIVVLTNPMNFDAVQRVTLGFAIIALAAFTARTLIKTRAGDKEQQTAATALRPAPEPTALANPSVAVTPSVPERLAEAKSNLQEKLPDLISDKAKPVEPNATKAPPITEQDIAIPPPPSDPSLTTPTPKQIIDEIYKDAFPFVNKTDLERSFIGMKVKWKLSLLKKMGTSTAGEFSAIFSADKAISSSVSITIPFKSSEQLRMSAEGDLFLVSGTIKSVNPVVVFLDDGKAERTGK